MVGPGNRWFPVDLQGRDSRGGSKPILRENGGGGRESRTDRLRSVFWSEWVMLKCGDICEPARYSFVGAFLSGVKRRDIWRRVGSQLSRMRARPHHLHSNSECEHRRCCPQIPQRQEHPCVCVDGRDSSNRIIETIRIHARTPAKKPVCVIYKYDIVWPSGRYWESSPEGIRR